MAKVKNQTIYSNDQEDLQRLEEEYRMIGFDTKLERNKLIIYALPRGKRK
jgi:hypothetical protein